MDDKLEFQEPPSKCLKLVSEGDGEANVLLQAGEDEVERATSLPSGVTCSHVGDRIVGHSVRTTFTFPGEKEDEGASGSNVITIILVGRGGAGKSTLAKSVFGLDTKTRLSSSSKRNSVKTYIVSKGGANFKIIDISLDEKNIRQNLEDCRSRFDMSEIDLVLYCLSISPGSRFDEFDWTTMRCLQDVYGAEVWRRCLVVFTYADLAWYSVSRNHEDKKAAVEDYKQHIKECAGWFGEELRGKLNVKEVSVKTVFDLDSAEQLSRDDFLVVFPAGLKHHDPVLPDVGYHVLMGEAGSGRDIMTVGGAAESGSVSWTTLLISLVVRLSSRRWTLHLPSTPSDGTAGADISNMSIRKDSKRWPEQDKMPDSAGYDDIDFPVFSESGEDAEKTNHTSSIPDSEGDEGTNHFIQGIEDAISRDEVIDRKLAHGMFVGPNGVGKSSLMDRLLGRQRKKFSPSTGVAEPVVVVDVSVDNPSTFHSVTVMESNDWDELAYDESLVIQMGKEVSLQQEAVKTSLAQETPVSRKVQVPRRIAVLSRSISAPGPQSSFPAPQRSQSWEAAATTPVPVSQSAIKNAVRQIVRKCGGSRRLKRFLKNTFSLYLRDTGGQVEFQEMLPLLIFGPSIFFFVFRLDQDFKGNFMVEFRKSDGESLNCYTSSITTEEAFLQCLASVYAMDTPDKAGVKTHMPLVFIVGTHRDKLKTAANEKIASLNNHLDSLIENNGFRELVQYADWRKGQVMFTVDNTSESDEDFKLIRSKVSSLIRRRDEFTIQYPIRYLLFSLELQNVKHSVLSLDECRNMAAKYGIIEDQVLHLLQFLHLRIGVIRYFNKDGVRHIVVKEPQALFNFVTSLVVATFSGDSLTDREAYSFEKKGILTSSLLDNAVLKLGNMASKELLQLLVHLRIAAQFTSSGDSEDRYFLPSVLNHIPTSCDSETGPETDILPLAVRFKCEHCPKGLFGVLVTHLMNPDPSDEATSNTTTFALMQDKIFKDQVSFEVQSPGVHDEMSLKAHPSHLEIKFFPECSEDRDTPISEVCGNVRRIVEASIQQSLQDLHYSMCRVRPETCFRCDSCSELHPVERGRTSVKTYCRKTRTTKSVPPQGQCWFSEACVSTSDGAAATTPDPPPLTHIRAKKFLIPLSPQEIRTLGLELGLQYPRLKKMRDECLLDEMLESWLREDDNVQVVGGCPSWESLVRALEEAQFNGVAAKVKKDTV